MKTVEEARSHILQHIRPMPHISSGLTNALGCVLAEPITAPFDAPRFDDSEMDGYAVRWCDVEGKDANGTLTLPVALEVPAGRSSDAHLAAGAAARIMTGARVPEGADTVIMREDTVEGEREVTIRSLPDRGKGAHIRHAGSYFRCGDLLMNSGDLIDPGAVGLLASLGVCRVRITRRPRVAVVSTGDELVELGEKLGQSQIYNSSAYLLDALIRQAGGVPVILPIARDTIEDCERRLDDALSSADMVITLGGVSVGDYDVVRDALSALGSAMGFWRVRMKPGKPLAFGMVSGKPIIGLPGNPVSGFVCFHQFVRPAICAARGSMHGGRLPSVQARLTRDLRSPSSRAEFQRGCLNAVEGGWEFEPLSNQVSGNSNTMVKVNALGVVPQGVATMEKGETITVECLPALT